MNHNDLRRLRRRAQRHGMSIHKDRESGGYRLIDVSDSQCGFDVFGGPVDLDDIKRRLDWMEEEE